MYMHEYTAQIGAVVITRKASNARDFLQHIEDARLCIMTNHPRYKESGEIRVVECADCSTYIWPNKLFL